MTQVTRVKKVEETTFVDPTGQPLPANPPILPLRLSRAKLSILRPPGPLRIDNIQAQISGLSFGVTRELFLDFRFS